MSESKTLLGIIELQEAKRIRALLEEKKVPLEFVSNPETCGADGKGCKPGVEVYFRNEDIEKVKAFLLEEKNRTFAGLEFNPESVASVFDANQEEADCPACGTRFQTKLGACSDCGLVFVSEGMEG